MVKILGSDVFPKLVKSQSQQSNSIDDISSMVDDVSMASC
jgi:hypothetical protein